jgi:hypothetical protein
MIDVSVVRDRLSAYHGTRVPRSIARFVAWLADDPEHVALLEERAYLLPNYDLAVAGAALPLPVRDTLRYHSEPPEFIAFARTGADGEHIGVLELAPELARDELPFVTYFPMDFQNEVCLLGDELGVALTTFVARFGAQASESLELPGLFEKALPAARWRGEPPEFDAPDGYRFVQTADRAGVLAPVDAFGPDVASLGYNPPLDALTDAVGRAARLLSAGFPASAIAVAREVRIATSDTELFEPACAVWRAAALELRRPWHAAMIDEIVAHERATRYEDSSRSYGPYTITNYAFYDGTP